ncbi:hypothetical protein MHBO_002087, partial [Bonamia ostreae]
CNNKHLKALLILCPKGILGDIFSFSKHYCGFKTKTRRGRTIVDVSGGSRLEELRTLLLHNLMMRRLKKDVQKELPKLLRQVMFLDISESLKHKKKSLKKFFKKIEERRTLDLLTNTNRFTKNLSTPVPHNDENLDTMSEEQIIGILKLSKTCEFLSQMLKGTDAKTKIVVFAHHKNVLRGLIQFAESKGIGYMYIQGDVLPEERMDNIRKFHNVEECRLALISITAGNTGFDLSCSALLVFAEMPSTQADLRQCESRAHRRNQTKSVNVYYLLGRGTVDEKRWRSLSKQLKNTTALLNDQTENLSVDQISFLDKTLKLKFGKFAVDSDSVSKSLETGKSKIAQKKLIFGDKRAFSDKSNFVLWPIQCNRSKDRKSFKNVFEKNRQKRLENEVYWRRKTSTKEVKTPFVYVMMSQFSRRVFLFDGPKKEYYCNRSVDIDDILSFPGFLNFINRNFRFERFWKKNGKNSIADFSDFQQQKF